jgi:Protein of unknown function (DUF3592)
MRNPLDLVLAFQALFGLAFLAVGGVLIRSRSQVRAYGGRTVGTIVSLRPRSRLSEAAAAVHTWASDVATIRFKTHTGDEVLAHSELRSDEAPGRPGDRVRILYDPNDPQRMRIDTTLGRGVLTAVWLLAVGTVIEVLAVATAVVAIAATAA